MRREFIEIKRKFDCGEYICARACGCDKEGMPLVFKMAADIAKLDDNEKALLAMSLCGCAVPSTPDTGGATPPPPGGGQIPDTVQQGLNRCAQQMADFFCTEERQLGMKAAIPILELIVATSKVGSLPYTVGRAWITLLKTIIEFCTDPESSKINEVLEKICAAWPIAKESMGIFADLGTTGKQVEVILGTVVPDNGIEIIASCCTHFAAAKSGTQAPSSTTTAIATRSAISRRATGIIAPRDVSRLFNGGR